MSKPAIFCQEIGFTLNPKAPMLSKIILVMSCPIKTIKNILISPILGASKIVPKTKNAPKTPPKNFHKGCCGNALSVSKCKTPLKYASSAKQSVPTRKEINALTSTEPPRERAKTAFIGACKAMAKPIHKANA